MRPDPLPATFPAQPTPAPAAAAAVGRLPTFHIVGFSGHRRLTDAAGAGVAIRGALEALQRQIPGEWIALSSIATGGDRVFVQQARAMVERGTLERMVPVLMTALAAGIALIPLVLAADEPGKEILHPVAVVIVGGLVSSTLLEFLVRPLMFFHFSRRAALQAIARQAAAAQ